MIPIKKRGLSFKIIGVIGVGLAIWFIVLAVRDSMYGESTKQEAKKIDNKEYTIAPKFFGCVNFKVMESKLKDEEINGTKR